jgi:hypothetical protein
MIHLKKIVPSQCISCYNIQSTNKLYYAVLEIAISFHLVEFQITIVLFAKSVFKITRRELKMFTT